jgi:hypothetical protein
MYIVTGPSDSSKVFDGVSSLWVLDTLEGDLSNTFLLGYSFCIHKYFTWVKISGKDKCSSLVLILHMMVL